MAKTAKNPHAYVHGTLHFIKEALSRCLNSSGIGFNPGDFASLPCLQQLKEQLRSFLPSVPLMAGWQHADKESYAHTFQHLLPLAAYAFKTNNALLSLTALSEIENWIDRHSQGGSHHESADILAFRLISFLYVLSLTVHVASDAQSAKIAGSLRKQACRLERAPLDTPVQALGLFMAGALCAQWRECQRWKAEGWKALLGICERYILSDGVGKERSLCKTACTIEILMLGRQVASATGITVPEIFDHTLAHAGQYLRWFIDSDGNVPDTGNNTFQSLFPETNPTGFVSSVAGCIAALYNREDITPPHYKPHLRNAWFGLPPQPPKTNYGLHSFEKGGYTVGRHLAHGQEVWLAINHGPDSVFSLWLHLAGKPVLVGTQNTLIMETQAINFPTQAKCLALETGDDYWQTDMVHQAYGIPHRRRVSLTPSRGLIVEDSIAGEARQVAINFLLHPLLAVSANGNNVTVTSEGISLLRIMHLSALKLNIAAQHTGTLITYSGKLKPGAKAVTDFAFALAV